MWFFLAFVSTRLCQTRFRLFSLFSANANTNEMKMNNGSKCYSTVCDSREKASISFLRTCRLCAYRKEERSIIIEKWDFVWFIFITIKINQGKKNIYFFFRNNNKKRSRHFALCVLGCLRLDNNNISASLSWNSFKICLGFATLGKHRCIVPLNLSFFPCVWFF